MPARALRFYVLAALFTVACSGDAPRDAQGDAAAGDAVLEAEVREPDVAADAAADLVVEPDVGPEDSAAIDGTGDGSDPADAADDPADAEGSEDGADTGDTGADLEDGSGDWGPGLPAWETGPYPDPGAWPPNQGPGGPARTFTPEELYLNCATLDGGDLDTADHHNLVVMYDGYLLMPWAPEWGGGGLTFFDVRDPCAPAVVGTGFSREMRETHAIGFSHHAGGEWAVVNQVGQVLTWDRGGLMFWDVSDSTAPTPASSLELPGFFYPDAYARVTLSVFWQAPFVYVAGADNGVYIVDATYPAHPRLVGQHHFEPTLRAGQVIAIGNLLFVSAAEGPRQVLLDISDPSDPQPISGGDFLSLDETDTPRENYFTNVTGGYSWHARKEGGGGLFVYDIRDPSTPTLAGRHRSPHNGGYVFVKETLAFVGESDVAVIYDVSDLANITPVVELDLEGDLDTATPIGNIAVLSVDDEAARDRGTAMAPYALTPDATPPRVTWSVPSEGATGLPPSSRIGVTFSEFIDPSSAWTGSVRLYETDTDPATTRVTGVVSAQDTIVNFWPVRPLEPATRYTLEIPAGGVVDYNGNAVAEPFILTFTTAP